MNDILDFERIYGELQSAESADRIRRILTGEKQDVRETASAVSEMFGKYDAIDAELYVLAQSEYADRNLVAEIREFHTRWQSMSFLMPFLMTACKLFELSGNTDRSGIDAWQPAFRECCGVLRECVQSLSEALDQVITQARRWEWACMTTVYDSPVRNDRGLGLPPVNDAPYPFNHAQEPKRQSMGAVYASPDIMSRRRSGYIIRPDTEAVFEEEETLLFCPSCGKALNASAVICPHCGADITWKILK